MKDHKKFWLVWNPSRHKPVRQHTSLNVAVEEAKRLAEKHPGQQFFILRAIGYAETEPDDGGILGGNAILHELTDATVVR